MNIKYILTDYIENALEYSEYEILEDGTFFGRVTVCKGVIAIGNNLAETSKMLKSVLEEWVLLGLKLGHELPVINGIDLNIGSLVSEHEAV
ncbi:MAG: type II toxin-antitoxin system HicB family antitoxin [Candidatus Kapabacteria bacterium]|nr:type II toxin-antitoxin system HicB family antitoxin [Candidatus Kapabacteria bacterium]